MFYILGGFLGFAEELLLRLESDLHNVNMKVSINSKQALTTIGCSLLLVWPRNSLLSSLGSVAP